jgi:hypothetical protein
MDVTGIEDPLRRGTPLIDHGRAISVDEKHYFPDAVDQLTSWLQRHVYGGKESS